MTEQRRTNLKELQKLDVRIQESRKHIQDFDPLFEQVEEPALILEGELTTAKNRLQEMKLEERRLQLSTEEKKTRREKLEERLGSVRNLREEAAVSAELEMVKRTLQQDEQEALTLMDQLRKMEERSAELEAAFAEASSIVEPKRQELLDQRAEAERALESLRAERERFVGQIDKSELKIYDAIRAGGRTIAVADLTHDGACGHCFGMVPLQLQNEIRHTESLIRCEACGVILSAPDPDAPAQPEPVKQVAEASADAEAVDEESGEDAGEAEDEVETAMAAAEADEDTAEA